jgi:ribosomal-protein-alanine N-acetyltransferase
MNETNWPDRFPVLITERLLLRSVTRNDSHGIYSSFSDPETMRYMGTPLDDPESVTGIVEDYMNGFNEGYSLVWALEEKRSGLFTGTAGFEEFSFLDQSAETGFTLLCGFKGKGYMLEAMHAILSFGFQSLGLNRIQAKILPENTGAINLVKQLGFTTEGCMRKSVFFNGSFHDELICSILREDLIL